MDGDTPSQGEGDERPVDAVLSEVDEQKRDSALAYILTSVDNSCKAMVWQMRCPNKAWNTLKETFKSVSEASTDAKLSRLQAVVLKKGEHIVEYSKRILGLVSELENAGHVVSEVEQERALLRGLPKDYDVTVETVMSFKHAYSEAVPKLIVREIRLRDAEDATPLALATTTPAWKQSRKCFYCGKPGHVVRDCRKKKADKE